MINCVNEMPPSWTQCHILLLLPLLDKLCSSTAAAAAAAIPLCHQTPPLRLALSLFLLIVLYLFVALHLFLLLFAS